jgi:hypothetical protein
MDLGRLAYAGPAQELIDNPRFLQQTYLSKSDNP